MPKVLITGVTGMVGSHLCDFLINNTDWEIFGMLRWRSPLDNLRYALEHPRSNFLNLVYGDLNDRSSLDYVVQQSQPDYVFHLAAQSFPKTSFTSPTDTLNTNIIGTQNLLESLSSYADNPVVHVCSSSEIFGRVPPEDLPINEQNSFHPASPYAISKVGTDLIGKFYAEAYGMKTFITRMFTHTGPRRGDVFAESTFAKQIAMVEAGMQEPQIKVGNLESLRTFADVRDAVRAYVLLSQSDFVPGEAFNIGGQHVCKIGEMLDYLLSQARVSNIKVVQDEGRMRPIDADLQVPDTTKFKSRVLWEQKYSFEQTMNDILDYWRNELSAGRVVINR